MSTAPKKTKATPAAADDDPITPELVDETPAPSAELAEAEEVEGLLVDYGGAKWRVPPSFDDLSIDAVESFSEIVAAGESDDASVASFRHLTGFLRELLGPQQWGRFKRSPSGSSAKDAGGLFRAIMAAYGEAAQGE